MSWIASSPRSRGSRRASRRSASASALRSRHATGCRVASFARPPSAARAASARTARCSSISARRRSPCEKVTSSSRRGTTVLEGGRGRRGWERINLAHFLATTRNKAIQRAREYRRFLDISIGSLAELGYAFRVAGELEMLSSSDWQRLEDLRRRAGFLTWRLYRSLGARGR